MEYISISGVSTPKVVSSEQYGGALKVSSAKLYGFAGRVKRVSGCEITKIKLLNLDIRSDDFALSLGKVIYSALNKPNAEKILELYEIFMAENLDS